MNPRAGQPDDRQAMMLVLHGHWASQIARTLAELRVPELLHEQERGADEVAAAAGTDRDATLRLLRAAVAAGLVVGAGEPGRERFSTTGKLAWLRVDAPDSLHHVARMWHEPTLWQPWGRLPQVVRGGRDQTVEALGRSSWEHLADHPDEAGAFNDGMAELSAPTIREAVEVVRAEPGDTVVDVGGGDGRFVLSLLERVPRSSGIVFERPHVIDAAQREIDVRGVGERCQAVDGDFFVSVPAGDLFLLKSVLHDWDDDACVAILRRCREAMRPNGRVVVVEMVSGPAADPGFAALMDLVMLATLSGRERTAADLDRLFTASGLRGTTSTALSGGFRVTEAVVADQHTRFLGSRHAE